MLKITFSSRYKFLKRDYAILRFPTRKEKDWLGKNVQRAKFGKSVARNENVVLQFKMNAHCIAAYLSLSRKFFVRKLKCADTLALLVDDYAYTIRSFCLHSISLKCKQKHIWSRNRLEKSLCAAARIQLLQKLDPSAFLFPSFTKNVFNFLTLIHLRRFRVGMLVQTYTKNTVENWMCMKKCWKDPCTTFHKDRKKWWKIKQLDKCLKNLATAQYVLGNLNKCMYKTYIQTQLRIPN